MRTDEKPYVLGTHDDELERLGLQAHLWRNQALGLWAQAGFARGHSLLDLGCGPGYTSLDLARVAGPRGRVLAVDASPRFIELLSAQPRVCDAAPIQAQVQDVQALELEPASLDGAWERWVLCFVPRPEKALQAVARALRPGAALALQEYVNYECMRLTPRSPIFEKVVLAVSKSFRQMGGDPDIAARLPGMLDAVGLHVERLEPVMRIARPGEELWQWPESFFLTYLPTLVERGLVTGPERAEFEATWREWSGRSDTAFYSPLQVGLVARKPR